MSPLLRKPESDTFSSRWLRAASKPADQDAYNYSGSNGLMVTPQDRYELMLDDEERFG